MYIIMNCLFEMNISSLLLFSVSCAFVYRFCFAGEWSGLRVESVGSENEQFEIVVKYE